MTVEARKTGDNTQASRSSKWSLPIGTRYSARHHTYHAGTVLATSLLTFALGVGSQIGPVPAATAQPVLSAAGTRAVGIQYTPQTVVVPAATVAADLRSVSPDGSTYTFASSTGALAKLKKGSVMLLQGTAVRLVTSVAAGPTGFVVGTAPASITDLLTNGAISWDTPIDFANAFAVQGPGVPLENAARAPASVNYQGPSRPAALLGSVAPRFGLDALSAGGVTLKGKAGSYSYKIAFKPVGSAVSITITLSKSSPVEVSATVSGTLQNLITAGGIDVSQGHLGSAKMQINGLKGQFTLSYELKPLTAFGLGAAGGFKLTLPGEITVPFVIGGIPFFLGVKTAFYVTVGFSNKNQSISGSYTINYDGNAGFSTSASGATTGTGVVQGIGKVLLDRANAILSGPVSLVLGAQVPQIELGLGVKGLNVAGFVDLVADTAIQVGGNSGAVGVTTGCDARELEVEATAGAEANFFGFSAASSSATLFSKTFVASYPPGCGTVGG